MPIWAGGRRASGGWSRLVQLLDVDGNDLLGQTWEPARLYAAHQALMRADRRSTCRPRACGAG